jgi:nucleotide-binding universal stress UspA family protein
MTLAARDVRVHSAVVVADDIPRAIARFAEASDEDLIAIATHGRGMMARAIAGSVAERVMSEGMLSMLVVHPAKLPVTERVGQIPLILPLAMA